MAEIKKTDEEWRKQLTPEQYAVTRRKGTEPAFTGEHWDNHEPGTYRCVCCGTPLFHSDTKYDSGTGWPSFWSPISPDKVRVETETAQGCVAWRYFAASAMRTWATFLTTAPSPPSSATA